jgi:hypothetical protein
MALLILNLGARRGGWSAPSPGRFTPGKDPVTIVQEAGWAPGPVWTCAKNLAPTGIRSPDRPARSQSLYRLSYPGPHLVSILIGNCLVLRRNLEHSMEMYLNASEYYFVRYKHNCNDCIVQNI